jgi:hypothetical protein
VLQNHTWTQKDLRKTRYAGKYSTHDFINRSKIEKTLDTEESDLEIGEHRLVYSGEKMKAELQVNRDYLQFFYEENFEEGLGEENFEEVIIRFLTPLRWRRYSDPLENIGFQSR